MTSKDWNDLILVEPIKYRAIGDSKSKIHTKKSILFSRKIKIAGLEKIEIQSTLNP